MAPTTPAAPTMTPVPKPAGTPGGVTVSHYWRREPSGPVVKQPIALPHDEDHNVVGRLFQCLEGDVTEWVFPPQTAPRTKFCSQHGIAVEETPLLPADADPVPAARFRRVAEVRQRMADAAQARVDAVRDAAQAKARRTYSDYRNHLPVAGTAAAALTGSLLLINLDQPLLTASIGTTIATTGAVIAYAAIYVLERRHIAASEPGRKQERRAARARRAARRAALAAVAGGGYLLAAEALLAVVAAHGLHPAHPMTAMVTLLGLLLTWATTHRPLADITARRDSQREAVRLAALARQAAEAQRLAELAEAAKRKAEVVANPVEEPEPVDETSPEAVGERMARRWKEISTSEFAGSHFPSMRHTWVIPESTVPVTVPIDGTVEQVGWQYLVASKPGALAAADAGQKPPIMLAKGWLASMLEIPPARIQMIDQPDNQINRALMVIADPDKEMVTATVPWRAGAGVRRESNGSIFVHIGRNIVTGEDVYETLYVPKQLSGGLTVGNPGGGKTGGTITKMMNLIVARGLPTLYDPKELVDYADFVGLFPIGVTPEHLEVIMRSRTAERSRRQKLLAQRKRERRERVLLRRLGKEAPEPEGEIAGAFNTLLDGPLFGTFWEEFHLLAAMPGFTRWLAPELRLQRAVAMFDQVITQGGGLQDLNDSVLRGILAQLALEIYPMPLSQARLAGHSGLSNPEKLPRVPGVLLRTTEGGREVAMRMAYISTDEDDEGNLYDLLLDADGNFKIQPPPLPQPMYEVLKREGLIDLWEMAKGPGGLDRLLAGTEPVVEAVTPEQAAGTVGRQIEAKYVILALVHDNPGCGPSFIRDNPIWTTAAGWSSPPDPPTISRAAKALEGYNKQGELVGPALLVRNRVEKKWTLTEEGVQEAKHWVAELASRAPADRKPALASRDNTAADVARQAELEAEQAAVARQMAEAAYAD